MAKAKAYEPCYTRTNKGGGTYVTCEGSQKGSSTKKAKPRISEKDKAGVLARRKAREEKAKKKASAIGGSPPKGTKVKVGTLNPGKLIKDVPKKKPAQKKPAQKKPAQKKPAQKKNEVSIKLDNDRVISWVVRPHTVSQTETLKLGQKLMKMIINPKTGFVDNKKFRVTDASTMPTELSAFEKKYYSDEKPAYIDGKFENEKFTWKALVDIYGKKPKYKTFQKSIKKK